jgi:hypothetical protein
MRGGFLVALNGIPAVSDRTVETLLLIIQLYILPGATIISDEWTVNESVNFQKTTHTRL